jgi:hypothetical protein
MYADYGVSFTDDADEVTYHGKLTHGISKFNYTSTHIPSNTILHKTMYIVGGLEEVNHLLNKWNKLDYDIWHYELNNN